MFWVLPLEKRRLPLTEASMNPSKWCWKMERPSIGSVQKKWLVDDSMDFWKISWKSSSFNNVFPCFSVIFHDFNHDFNYVFPWVSMIFHVFFPWFSLPIGDFRKKSVQARDPHGPGTPGAIGLTGTVRSLAWQAAWAICDETSVFFAWENPGNSY